MTCFSGLFLCSRSTTPYFDLKIFPPLDRCKWCNYIQSPGQREEDNLIPTSLLISSLHEKSYLNNTRVKRDPHSSSNDAKGRTFVSLISPRTPCYGEPHACWGSELSREEQVLQHHGHKIILRYPHDNTLSCSRTSYEMSVLCPSPRAGREYARSEGLSAVAGLPRQVRRAKCMIEIECFIEI